MTSPSQTLGIDREDLINLLARELSKDLLPFPHELADQILSALTPSPPSGWREEVEGALSCAEAQMGMMGVWRNKAGYLTDAALWIEEARKRLLAVPLPGGEGKDLNIRPSPKCLAEIQRMEDANAVACLGLKDILVGAPHTDISEFRANVATAEPPLVVTRYGRPKFAVVPLPPDPPTPSPEPSGWPTHVHADGGFYRFIRHIDGRADNHEPWTAGVLYEGEDGRQWWTGNDRWFDRFTALSGGMGRDPCPTGSERSEHRDESQALSIQTEEGER